MRKGFWFPVLFLLTTTPVLFLQADEYLLDTTVVYVPALRNQHSPSAAFGPTNFLVVWYDNRNGSFDIYGAVVAQSGFILDSAGIVVSDVTDNQEYPAIVFGGLNFFVVWQDRRNGADYDIYGARVDQDGVVLDPDGIAISTAANSQEAPSVSFDGTNYFVVWQDGRNGGDYDIYGARVSQGGIVLDSFGLVVSSANGFQLSPSAVFNGTNFLTVWSDDRSGSYDIYAARVESTGNVIDTSGICISNAPNGQEYPKVAIDTANYLVVWQDWRNASYDIYCARVNRDGMVLEASGISVSTEVNYQEYPSVAFDGANYLVVWRDDRVAQWNFDIYGARVGQDGVVLDPLGLPISTAVDGQDNPSIAFGDTDFFVVWRDRRSGSSLDYDIYGARVEQSGSVIDSSGIIVSTSANYQGYARAAFDGQNYLAVWQDKRHESYHQIHGMRLDQTGNALDSAGIAISVSANNHMYPSVAYGNMIYLVTWADNRSGMYDIYGARIDQTGVVLDSAGFIVTDAVEDQNFASVAYGGMNHLAAWMDNRNGNSDIYGSRIDQSGAVVDTSGIAISRAGGNQIRPAVVFGDTNYLVIWQDRRSGADYDIYGARVNQTGIVFDSSGIAIATGGIYQEFPAVAFGGINYLAVWQASYNIYGARITQAGVVLDPSGIPISTAPGRQEYPSVSFDDSDYVVVWQDSRNGLSYDLYGAKVNVQGVVIDSFPVCLQPGDQILPAVVRGSGGQTLITWSGWTDSISGRPANTLRIWSKFYPLSTIEEHSTNRTSVAGILRTEVYPNPFKHYTEIMWQATNFPRNISLKIYDVTGRLVRQFNLLSTDKSAARWCGDDDYGNAVSQGIYFLRVENLDTSKVSIHKILKVE